MPQDALNPIVQKMIDAGESEDNIATVIKHYKATTDFGPATPPAAPPVDRGGLAHPMTSLAAPELEAVRGKLNAATAVPSGQPYMARSRTGAMYPSETGTGAVNAAKSFGRGFGGDLITQAEGATSPLGIAALAAGPAISKVGAASPATKGIIGRNLRMISDFDVTKPLKSTLGVASDAFEASAARGVPQAVQDAQMGVARGADMYAMPRAESVVERAPRAAQVLGDAPAAVTHAKAMSGAPSLSPADRASLVKQGMTPEGIAKLEQQMGAGAAPITGALRMAPEPPPMPAASLPQPVPAIEPPANWNTTVPDKVGHALDPARVDIGAEATGRAAGMTKQQVRDVATPILDAAPGEASPILPEAALKRMVDTLKALPPGGPEREAYVARATSGKTQWQVENIRRTLEHLGLVVPVAAAGGATLRTTIMNRLRGGSEQPGQ